MPNYKEISILELGLTFQCFDCSEHCQMLSKSLVIKLIRVWLGTNKLAFIPSENEASD
jgi:hypothetical protein